jgi:alpha-L-fucosidase
VSVSCSLKYSALLLVAIITTEGIATAKSQKAAGTLAENKTHTVSLPLDQPRPLPGPRPGRATIAQWQSRRFGMFIHFGLYSNLGGVWQGRNIDNGYSEQIMANAPIPLDQYAALASKFNPTEFDPDAIVALAKAAGMKFIVITAKHHDGFNMYGTRQTAYNIVDATPYHKDVVKLLSQACRRGGIKFGVYYSSIDWHQPGASTYIEGNSNPIPSAQEAFNVAQLKELLGTYGPISEIWFDMGKPTPAQSEHFARTVHDLQPQTMVSGRVFNYQGDFSVMGDNAVPSFVIDEPWQTPASFFDDTWGYRSWQKREDLHGKIRENILRLVEVVSRGGNYILNIGPEGDGSVVPYEADVLHGIGRWMSRNGQAIYGTSAQPFRNLDFGYATVGGGNLYLFVKSIPKDGVLRLPPVPDATMKAAFLLGDSARTPIAVEQAKSGITLSAKSLRTNSAVEGDPANFLPVVVVPFAGKLRAQSPLISGDTRGFSLKPAQADRFYNYNGHGYEAPAILYKLRWTIAAIPGTYQLKINYTPAHAASSITLFLDGVPTSIHLNRPSQEGSETVSTYTQRITLRKTSVSVTNRARVEVTPAAPFYKGTQLPVEIKEVDIKPAGK